MSRLSKTHIVILIVVFLVIHIQAADDNVDDNATMCRLSQFLMGRRESLAQNTERAEYVKTCMSKNAMEHLKSTLKKRQYYKPKDSPLTLRQLSQDPDSGNSKERLKYVMAYNAYQYGCCKLIYVKILNTLVDDVPGQEVLLKKCRKSLVRHSKKLLDLMNYYLTLEVRYAIALGEVAPHFRTRSPTRNVAHGNGWTAIINGVRAKQVFFARLIDAMKANKISVSLKDVTNDSVLGLKGSPLSMKQLSMEPTSNMPGERLHYVMKCNALMLEKFKFKSAQLTKVLDDVPMGPELRRDLEDQQKNVHAMMENYLRTANEYAKKIGQTHAPYARAQLEMLDMNELAYPRVGPRLSHHEYVSMHAPYRQELKDQQENFHVKSMETNRGPEYKYAQKLDETAPYGGVGFEQARPPSSDFVDATL
ncbi:hypothetical protein SeMB42_g06872, partial [Synchytrium endobioticum]